MSGAALDPRRNAVRDDLADARLEGVVARPRYAEPIRRSLVVPNAGCHVRPAWDAPLGTELMYGESVDVFDAADKWAWVQSAVDGYVGYVHEDYLGPPTTPTHRIAAPLGLMFVTPDIRRLPRWHLPMGAWIVAGGAEVVGTERFHAMPEGHVLAQHVVPLGTRAPDWVAVAERFVGAPYQWGGKTWTGIDCSGLVQVALAAAGIAAPRDSDMQAAELGTPTNAPIARGDLVFWKGHVGIMLDETRLLHANGFHQATVIEPLADAVARHEAKGLPVTVRRRLP